MSAPDGPFTLPEVADMTGLSLRSIERGCRNGTIEHIPIGDGTKRQHRRMYLHQVDKLKAARKAGATVSIVPAEASPDDDLAEAKAASRARLARRTGRRAA